MKQHPIIKELFINETGTQIEYKNKPLKIKVYHRSSKDNYPRKLVNFMGRTHSLVKLICETYHGMRKDGSYTVQRKDFNPENDHQSNLFWGKRGSRIISKRKKRCKTSKIKDSDIPVIIQRLRNKETLKAIAKSYDVSDMSIHRIKQHYVKPLKILKQNVINAKSKEELNTAFAKHFGYKSIGIAIQKMGRHEFESAVDSLIKQL